jgi:hypothetical protein
MLKERYMKKREEITEAEYGILWEHRERRGKR